MKLFESLFHRRTLLTRFGGGAAVFAATLGGAAPQSGATARWQPERDQKDDWLDRLPGKHRLVFDTTMPESFGYALLYAGNYFIANQEGYGLQDSDLAVVIVARHFSTPFAFNDAMWKKYGDTISHLSNFVDPKTKQAPAVNL
jgi:hypothetical protein